MAKRDQSQPNGNMDPTWQRAYALAGKMAPNQDFPVRLRTWEAPSVLVRDVKARPEGMGARTSATGQALQVKGHGKKGAKNGAPPLRS